MVVIYRKIDTIIKLILYSIICIGAIFTISGKFVDTQIIPKWVAMFAGVILLVSYLIFRILFCLNTKDNDENRNESYITGVIIIVTFLQALYGILQFFNLLSPTTAFPATGSFENPAGFAVTLCAAFPFYINAFLRSEKLWRWIIGSMITLVIIVVILSSSRAGVLSLAAILIFFCIQHTKLLKKIKWTFFTLLLPIITIGLYFLKKDSADGRLLIWKCSLSMIKDNWLFGHGIGGFKAHYMNYQADYFKNNPNSLYTQLADDIQQPFNEYIHILADYGIVGILMLIICVVYLIHCYFKYPSLENKVAISCWLSVGIFAFFSYPLLYPFIWFILVYSAYLLIRQDIVKFLKYISGRTQKVVALSMLCFLIYSGIQLFHRLQSEWEWKKAVSCESRYAICQYQNLAKTFTNNCYFLYSYAVVLFENNRFEESYTIARQCRKHWINYDLEILLGDICKKTHMYQQAESHYQRASMMCPCRFYPLNLLYDLYQEAGDTQKALAIAQKVKEKPIKVKSLVVMQIKYKMKQALLKSETSE